MHDTLSYAFRVSWSIWNSQYNKQAQGPVFRVSCWSEILNYGKNAQATFRVIEVYEISEYKRQAYAMLSEFPGVIEISEYNQQAQTIS